ncbi:hypothetical protein KCP73_22055 [Salmonella enterica subsp. enterica]|nr:hypothetical protein KCP73_22055 [Salmonella enterica subsp. enterica]
MLKLYSHRSPLVNTSQQSASVTFYVFPGDDILSPLRSPLWRTGENQMLAAIQKSRTNS